MRRENCSIHYRPDIDGLRALAVLLVVFYHADKAFVPGGFVGVDVFFVISGFLITKVILGEVSGGRFSIVDFYRRRVSRLFPALFAMFSVVSVLSFYYYMPGEFSGFVESLVYASIFLSNVFFLSLDGYFSPSAEGFALLHTWSLAIEEQFYFIFPIMLLLLLKFYDTKIAARVFLLLMVLSVSLSIYVSNYEHGFYLLPFRAYELLVGVFLGMRDLSSRRNAVVIEIYGWFGLFLIFYSAFAFDGGDKYPSWRGLFPCLGAAFVIYSGSDGRGFLLARILGSRIFVYFGLISYSLYLWHWPIFVFAKRLSIGEIELFWQLILVVFSIFVATLSWKYIELPVLRASRGGKRKYVLPAGATSIVVVLAFSLVSKDLQERFNPRPKWITELASYTDSRNPDIGRCADTSPDLACMYGDGDEADIVLLGDSHATAIAPILKDVILDSGMTLKTYLLSGCPSGLGFYRIDKLFYPCPQYSSIVLNKILRSETLRTVVLYSRWAMYTKGDNTDYGVAERNGRVGPIISVVNGQRMDEVMALAALKQRLKSLIEILTARNINVVLVYPTPEIGYDVPVTLARYADAGIDPSSLTVPMAYFMSRQREIIDFFDDLEGNGRLLRLVPHERMCDRTGCRTIVDGKPLYFDDDHLSLAGGEFLRPAFVQMIEDLRLLESSRM